MNETKNFTSAQITALGNNNYSVDITDKLDGTFIKIVNVKVTAQTMGTAYVNSGNSVANGSFSAGQQTPITYAQIEKAVKNKIGSSLQGSGGPSLNGSEYVINVLIETNGSVHANWHYNATNQDMYALF